MSRKLFTALAFVAAACVPAGESFAQDAPASHRALLDRYCVTCHNERLVAGRGGAPSPLVSQLRAIGLTLDTLDLAAVGDRPEVWETVVRKLRGGMMPPAGRPRPDDDATLAFAGWLESELDRVAAARPDPGRTAPLHRLNRAEYRNAVRDLLARFVGRCRSGVSSFPEGFEARWRMAFTALTDQCAGALEARCVQPACRRRRVVR